jgi:hypothetical protein
MFAAMVNSSSGIVPIGILNSTWRGRLTPRLSALIDRQPPAPTRGLVG